MTSLQYILLIAAVLLRSASSFMQPTTVVSGIARQQRQDENPLQLTSFFTLSRMTSGNEESEKQEPENDELTNKQPDSSKPAQDPTPPPQMQQTPPPPPPKRMDPLLASLTRVDPQQANSNAPKKTLPLLGEVTLDRNLFIILPIAGFAVLGLISFLLVAINSQDAFVDAINEWNDSIMKPPSPAPIDPNECRGLCSSQQEDLEGLRSFMEGISGKK